MIMETVRIGDLPDELKPFEKYQKQGIDRLSDIELLALILRTGTKKLNCIDLCKKVLDVSGGTLAGLYGKTEKELQDIEGVGPVKAVKIICICELARRIARTKRTYDESLDTADKIAMRYMEEMRHFKEEHVVLLLLDIKCRLIKEITISIEPVFSKAKRGLYAGAQVRGGQYCSSSQSSQWRSDSEQGRHTDYRHDT